MKRKSYLIKTDIGKASTSNCFTVYAIHVGDMVYIGMTNNLKNRISSHKWNLDRIANGLPSISKSNYSKFNKDQVMNGYWFEVLGTTNDVQSAAELECKHINNQDPSLLLNIKKPIKTKDNIAMSGRKKLSPLEKVQPIRIWVKEKFYNAAKKELMKIQAEYEKLN